MGTSRPNGINTYHTTIHAEIQAVKSLYSNPNKHKLQILLWRVNKDGSVVPAYSCLCCSKYIIKKNLEHKVFTFHNEKKISALIKDPELSKGMKIKFGYERFIKQVCI